MADDLISRQALKDAFRAYMVEHFDKDKCVDAGNCNVCEKRCLWHEVVASVPTIDPESLRPKGEWVRGAIISGYQGIGKSTLAKNGSGYIDLESGNFFVGGVRADDWYIPYCQIAIHLAEQGYRVFVSSHAVVREYLSSLPKTVDLFVCFPSFNLRGAWVKKLEERYQASRLDKDYRAWKNAEDHYPKNIKELHETKGFMPIVIHDMSYSLERLIDNFCPNCGADMRGEGDG